MCSDGKNHQGYQTGESDNQYLTEDVFGPWIAAVFQFSVLFIYIANFNYLSISN
jgi:hypothetical protein